MAKELDALVKEEILTPATNLTMKDEEKEDFDQGFVFDNTPGVLTRGHYTSHIIHRKELLEERAAFSKYLVSPIKLPFSKLVRTLSILAKFIRIFQTKHGKKSKPAPSHVQRFEAFQTSLSGEPVIQKECNDTSKNSVHVAAK